MAKLVNLIPNSEKRIQNESLDDMDVSLPSTIERFLDRTINVIKGYKLPRKKEQLIMAKIVDAMHLSSTDLQMAMQKLKQYKIVSNKHTNQNITKRPFDLNTQGESIVKEGPTTNMIRLKDLLKEESFLDNFKKVNKGYDPKSIIASFSKESGRDNADVEDRADHKRYVKDMIAWFDKMEKNGPTVKVGDLVKVNMRSNGKEGIGKIVAATKMAGNFGFMGQAAPDNQPAWKIDCYTERNIGTTKKPIEYKGKTYYYMGTVQYPQHEEGNKNTFSKLK